MTNDNCSSISSRVPSFRRHSVSNVQSVEYSQYNFIYIESCLKSLKPILSGQCNTQSYVYIHVYTQMIIDGSIYSLMNLGYDGGQWTSLWSLGCYKSPQFEVYVPEDVVQRARKRVEDESLG